MPDPYSQPVAGRRDYLWKLKRGFYDDASFIKDTGGDLVLNSFTGCDVNAFLLMPEPENKEQVLATMGLKPEDYPFPTLKQFAELETISISSARSVFPVRRIGEDHVHRYTRGGRSIAGTMVFTTFSRDVFAEFYRVSTADNFFGQNANAPFFVDQIPPFHIMLSAANEYGMVANAALINVTLSNWGTTLSIHDLKIESTYTYVAQFFFPFVQDYNGFMEKVKVAQGTKDSVLSELMVQKSGGYSGSPKLRRPDFVLEPEDVMYRQFTEAMIRGMMGPPWRIR